MDRMREQRLGQGFGTHDMCVDIRLKEHPAQRLDNPLSAAHSGKLEMNNDYPQLRKIFSAHIGRPHSCHAVLLPCLGNTLRKCSEIVAVARLFQRSRKIQKLLSRNTPFPPCNLLKAGNLQSLTCLMDCTKLPAAMKESCVPVSSQALPRPISSTCKLPASR